MAYSAKVLDHYENPRNVGSLDKNDPNVGTGMVGAPACGDVLKLQIKINDDTGIIEDAKFKTYGCGSAIAASSLVTGMLIGKTKDEAQAIKNTAIVEELALPPVKIHCSVLAEDAIKGALAVQKAGKKHFTREILHLCKTRSELSYFETYEIFTRDALVTHEYYNDWVTCRIRKDNLISKPDTITYNNTSPKSNGYSRSSPRK